MLLKSEAWLEQFWQVKFTHKKYKIWEVFQVKRRGVNIWRVKQKLPWSRVATVVLACSKQLTCLYGNCLPQVHGSVITLNNGKFYFILQKFTPHLFTLNTYYIFFFVWANLTCQNRPTRASNLSNTNIKVNMLDDRTGE